jgi:hypothetical protein
MTEAEQVVEDIAQYADDPLGFALYAFPWGEPGELEDVSGPRVWQADILDTIGRHLRSENRFDPLRISVSSGHGVGKSALISMVCGWGMSCYVDARINVTANTGKQLDTKTWPELAIWFRRLINADWFKVKGESVGVKDKGHEETWRIDAVPWSENNPAAFAGLHNKRKIVILVMDEASEIPYIVWETSEGALTDEDTVLIFLAFGNPTQNTGAFRECFGKNKHRWVRKQIDSRQVEGTNKKLLSEWVDDYGEDSDFVRVRVRGEFPRAGSSQFIAGDVVADARKRNVGDQSRAYKILSVDVARFGDDQTVIGYRQGLRAVTTDKIRGMDTIQVGRQVIMRILQERPRSVVVDGDGIGGGVVDYVRTYLPKAWKAAGLPHTLRKTGGTPEIILPEWFRIEEFHGGATPGDQFMYFNKRAEVWGKLRDWLVTAQIPDDPELEADLTGPEYYHSNKNQIQLERKEDMKKRGLSSPDTGDMLAMTFGVTPMNKTRDEALVEDLANTPDPMERHFKMLRETDRREKAKKPLQFWE